MKLNRTIVLLIVGLVVFEIISAILVGMTGNIMGADFVAGISNAMTLIRLVNICLCVLLVSASLFADKLKQYSIVPIACCAIELLLSLGVIVVSWQFLMVINTPDHIIGIAAQGIRNAGLGMLLGMVLAIMAGMLLAKKRIILPLLIIVVVAILSVVAYLGMLTIFDMGLASMIAVGFLQPFAFLFPAFAFDGAERNKTAKEVDSVSAEKSSETKGYSYLEAYKNKHK